MVPMKKRGRPATKLKPECGVTKVSQWNALILLKKFGMPSQVRITTMRPVPERDVFDYLTVLSWEDPAYTHTCTGFSWGYGGEGPHGLLWLFEQTGIKVDIDMIAYWRPAEQIKRCWWYDEASGWYEKETP